jgi:hypothetical protein
MRSTISSSTTRTFAGEAVELCDIIAPWNFDGKEPEMIARANCSVASGQRGRRIAAPIGTESKKNKVSPVCQRMRGSRKRGFSAPLSPIFSSIPAVGAIAATASRSPDIEVFHQSRR